MGKVSKSGAAWVTALKEKVNHTGGQQRQGLGSLGHQQALDWPIDTWKGLGPVERPMACGPTELTAAVTSCMIGSSSSLAILGRACYTVLNSICKDSKRPGQSASHSINLSEAPIPPHVQGRGAQDEDITFFLCLGWRQQ